MNNSILAYRSISMNPMILPVRARLLLPLGLFVVVPALADVMPVDHHAPAAMECEEPIQPEKMPVRNGALLGLVADPIPELLTTHLGIREREGVLVSSVLTGGPAENAGIRVNDLIITIDDKIIFSPGDIAGCIESHQPGDQVKFGLLSHGKAKELNVTLGKKPDMLADLGVGSAIDMIPLEGLREAIKPRIGGENVNPGMNPMLEEAIKKAIENRRDHRPEMQNHQGQRFDDCRQLRLKQNMSVRVDDELGSLEFASKDGAKRLTVRDLKGGIEWEGPWATDEDKAAAPEAVQRRAENTKPRPGAAEFRFHQSIELDDAAEAPDGK